MVLNATFDNISVISWQKSEDLEKITDLSQVTDKLITYCFTSRPDRDPNSQHEW